MAKRAKDLVRRWRDMVLPSAHSTPQPTPADTAPPALNGAKPHSPALRCFKPQSPALRSIMRSQSPLLRDTLALRVSHSNIHFFIYIIYIKYKTYTYVLCNYNIFLN